MSVIRVDEIFMAYSSSNVKVFCTTCMVYQLFEAEMNIERVTVETSHKQTTASQFFSAEMNGFCGISHYQQHQALAGEIETAHPLQLISPNGQIASPREPQDFAIQ
ncbi:hypothetical protein [Veronia pacifica]|uniref:Uncharacterized protein n=1 Tax=Veronia pacifica TaxID=1080227 RepID=A0A1C3EAD8_9GAMM|nr:hypothetical protein [Veronia pacifica]ODA30170.1 hypothetical protein A8L45_20935 [Veronia pacifica]